MAEILPSTAQPYDEKFSSLETTDGYVESREFTGEKTALEALKATYTAQIGLFNSGVTSVQWSDLNGRAVLTVYYERKTRTITLGDDGSIQELYALDVVRDIKCAPYFESLSDAEMSAVQLRWDSRLGADSGWNDLQKQLYAHMAKGQESYNETAYEFRQTFQTSSSKQLRAASSDPNTVQELPNLSGAMKKLIDSLPDGEWLKKPTSVQFAGPRGYTVTLVYQWAPKWSVIYGGTFTGL